MGPRIVVIGAGVAGLFAAAAGRDAGWEVVVLERDQLDTTGPRPGVPQGSHPHIYLLRGLRSAEQLVPGLTDDLRAAGAVPFNTAAAAWRAELGWYPVGSLHFDVLSLTRPLFESVLRRRVLDSGGIDLRDGARATGLATGSDGRWEVETTGHDRFIADLVVDASGRSTRLPAWLRTIGVSAPPIEHIDARAGYATRMYVDGPDLGALSGVVVQATPGRPTGAGVLPVENGRHLVSLIGFGEHRPPRDEAGFVAFTHELVDPAVADFIAAARPIGPVSIHRQTANRHHHFERIRGWPDGLVPIGDAFVAFNPVYGQGVTVAAGQAVQLRSALRTGRDSLDTSALLRRFAALARLPWQIAVAQDRRQPACPEQPSRFDAISGRWVLTVQNLAVHGDLRAVAAVNRLYHLLAPPAALLHPALLLAAARASIFGYPAPVPRPAALPGPPS